MSKQPPMTIVGTGWFTPTLLLTPQDERDAERMGRLFAESSVLGLAVDHDSARLLTEDGWIGPLGPSAASAAWAEQAREQEQAVLLVGPTPRLADEDALAYVRRYAARCRRFFAPVYPDLPAGAAITPDDE